MKSDYSFLSQKGCGLQETGFKRIKILVYNPPLRDSCLLHHIPQLAANNGNPPSGAIAQVVNPGRDMLMPPRARPAREIPRAQSQRSCPSH